MFDFKLNKNGDIALNDNTGSIDLITEKDELGQKITDLLNINTHEIDWNPEIGLDQHEVIMNAKSENAIESMCDQYLREQLGDSYTGCKVEQYHVNRATRTAYITLSVNLDTDDGTITVQSNLNVGGDQ